MKATLFANKQCSLYFFVMNSIEISNKYECICKMKKGDKENGKNSREYNAVLG